ncbi:uncharacterized protein ACBR49_016463 [Aulostomus maculatus]
MKMKGSSLGVTMVMVALFSMTNSATTTKRTMDWPWTTGSPPRSLKGKMVTLSVSGGGITLCPPYYSLSPSSPTSPPSSNFKPDNNRPTASYPSWTTASYPSWTTASYPSWTTASYPSWTTASYPSWTTAPPTNGVTVCLSYLVDLAKTPDTSIFTLSPSSRYALVLGVDYNGVYRLTDRYSYYNTYLRPSVRFWSNMGRDIWTRVCVVMDGRKNVAQVFSGAFMSIRKILPAQYMWSGEPRIEFSGFDGQVTDVQVWDYPIPYTEIFNYMTGGLYRPCRGSVLTWDYIQYSLTGSTLLEDSYAWKAKEPPGGRGQGHQPKGEWRSKKFLAQKGKIKKQRF